MNGTEIDTLIRFGATDKARRYLKKLGMKSRMSVLQDCIPNVNATPASLKFFKENFSREIGALMMSDHNIDKAVELYNTAKNMK
jgi:hypothetical protein